MTQFVLAFCLLLGALPAVAVNKCVESTGRLIFTDMACPSGTQGPATPAVMPRPASAPPAASAAPVGAPPRASGPVPGPSAATQPGGQPPRQPPTRERPPGREPTP